MYKFFAILIILFLATVYLVNPVRELAKDDDWAYALTVKNLLETGKYELHEFATANMPAQIYWGVLFARLFGYSFTALRFSTLLLLFIGLIAFYFILRDFGSDDIEASISTLSLFASPLVMLFGFTFMSNVPFLAWLILSIWLYTKAIRRENYVLIILASVFASFAICTRQFGMAIPIALFATWIIKRRNTNLYIAGLSLPVLSCLWQCWVVMTRPSIAMITNITRETAYLSNLPCLMTELFWRPTVIFQYLGLFLLPLLPLYIWRVLKLRHSLIWAFYILIGIAYGYLIRGVLMPSIRYNLAAHFNRFPFSAIPSTILTGGIAIILGWTLLERTWKTQEERFLLFTFIALLGLHLIYVDFVDEYLITFIPFALFAVGVKQPPWPKWCRVSTGTLCLITLVGWALWTYVILERKEAYWRAAEFLHSSGVPAEQIHAGEWDFYHSVFQDWVDTGEKDLFLFFSKWMPSRIQNAKYRIVDSSDRWIHRVEYRWFDLSKRYVYVIEQKPGS